MNLPKTVPTYGAPQVTVKANVQHRCPFVHEIDYGTARITWIPQGNTIEIHSLRDYLATWADTQISHEDITQAIHMTLGDLDGLYVTDVTTTWNTAGMEVSCSTSQTRAGEQR